MSSISRRDAMLSLATGGTGFALSSTLLARATHAQIPPADAVKEEGEAPSKGSFRGQHQLRPLSFDPAKLQGLSEKLITSHWQNNYGGSIKALNKVELKLNALLQDPDVPAFLYGDLKREELHRTGSVVLHEFYFGNLGGNGQAGGNILAKLKEGFTSFEQWQSEFKKTASSLAGGSGWTVLGYNFFGVQLPYPRVA